MEGAGTDASDVTVEAKDSGGIETEKNVSNIDLKNILAIAVTAVISVGCAFLFVTRIYNSKDVYDIRNVADTSSIVDADSASKENINIEENPEKEEDKKEKNKSKKREVDSENTENSENSSNALSKILVPMDSIVVNLGKVDSRRYLRILISLEVDNAETEKEVKKNKVIFRDKLISFLSTKNPTEIGSPSNQSMLRSKIKDLLNKEFFKAAEVITQVYFSDLIVQ